jgi:hypothetical protein
MERTAANLRTQIANDVVHRTVTLREPERP